MNLYDYTAFNNRQGSSEVVRNYGMNPANDPKGLSEQLKSCVRNDGQRALDQITSVHPDLELFQSRIDELKDKYRSEKDSFIDKHFSNANGQSIKRDVTELHNGNNKDSSKDLLIKMILQKK